MDFPGPASMNFRSSTQKNPSMRWSSSSRSLTDQKRGSQVSSASDPRFRSFTSVANLLLSDSEEAISEFEQLLSITGKKALEAHDFVELLHDLDLGPEVCEKAFDDILNFCAHASIVSGETASNDDEFKQVDLSSSSSQQVVQEALKSRRMNTQMLRALYMSPTYTDISSGKNRAMEFSNTLLGKVKKLYHPKENDTTDEVYHESNYESDRWEIQHMNDLEEAATAILKYDCSTNDLMSIMNLKDFHYDPAHCSADEFVDLIEKAVLNHDVVNHHLIDSLSKGSYGDNKTLEVVLNFLQAYSFFSVNFIPYLQRCVELCSVKNPYFREILTENLDEESGKYDDETLENMVQMNLDPKQLIGVSHSVLFRNCVEILRQKCVGEELPEDKLIWIASPLVQAFHTACVHPTNSTAETSIAALYFTSELIVNQLYSKLSQYLRIMPKDDNKKIGDIHTKTNSLFSNQDLAFFILHMDMDVKHAEKMKQIVLAHACDEKSRKSIANTVNHILSARVEFYDRLIEAVFPPTGHSGIDTGTLYNKQSTNWVRTKATCLSDFTGRPIVFNMCAPYVDNTVVLDVGCGEGYVARKLVEMGASRLVGIDVSEEMVARAKQNDNSNKDVETYIVGDATKLIDTITSKPAELGIMPGLFIRGCFDLALSVFLFNYTNIKEMKTISSQVFRLLKPGGRFIFSVPHPFMLNAHGDESGDSTFSFAKGGASSDKYFSLRGRKFSGVIKRVDGCPLNVKMDFKTISDYVETLRECGFEIGNIHEARVLPEHVSEHPTFFNSVKDSPLHLVFDVSKPKASKSLDGVQYPPKQIIWSNFQKKHASKILNMRLPDEAVQELRSLVYELVNKGITVDTFDHHDTYMKKLPNVAVFATYVRKQLVHTVGAALVNGLDLESYKAEGESSDEFCHIRAKLAYYILCSLIGKVDGSSRGRQFEVKNTGNSTKADNVLFSVSDDEAPWHTDGASVDKVYNVASLLCITQADEGGAFHLSNACNAFHELKKKLPKFLLYELTRALPRHVLEKGHGQGIRKGSIGINLRRSNTLMEDRVRYNSYPIFQEEEGNRLRIRYMRYWIETGHEKAGLAVSPLLRLAMDALDSALQKEEVFNQRLTPGQMVFCNNELFVHSRDHFVDSPSSPPRLMIRTWINVDGLED